MLDAESLTQLKTLDLSENRGWFRGRQKSVDLLLSIIRRQPALTFLNLDRCKLSREQVEQITEALADSEHYFDYEGSG